MTAKCSLFIVLQLLIISAGITPSVSTQTPNQRALSHSGSVGSLPPGSKRYALVVGVDEYQDTQINRLGGASNDAKALGDALIRYAGFLSEQVVLLTSNQPVELQPTRTNILRRLSNLGQVVPKDGLLLVSFAGHGIERDGQAYLLPMDAQVNGDIALLEDSAINVKTVRDRIRANGVGQVILILDACRNNPMAGRGNTRNPLTDAYTRAFNFDIRNRDIKAFATLYATGVGQVAHEYKEKKQGYFTWALVEGLKARAANEKGEVTLRGLLKYVEDTVPKRTQIDLGAGMKQIPWADIQGYKADDLVIAVAAPAAPATVSGTPADPLSIELSFWETIKNSGNADDFKAYLQQYPNGRFAALARIRIDPLTSARADAETRKGPAVSGDGLSKSLGDDPVSGLWLARYGPGAFPFTLKLKLQGETVTGQHVLEGISSQLISGRWAGGELVLTITHGKSKFRMVATFDGSKLVGKKYIDGSTTPLEWSAQKQ